MYDMQRERLQFENLSEDRMMDAATRDAYLRAQGNPQFIALGEARDFPLHSPDEIPTRWANRKNGDGFKGEARPGEYYAFQVGIYATDCPLENLQASWSDLTSADERIMSDRITCFNLEGMDCLGKSMSPVISVAPRHMQSLWFGVQLPTDAVGTYEGRVAVWAHDVAPVTVHYSVQIAGQPIADHGDDEPWRHSRLRWLNSDIAMDEAVTSPFAPITLKNDIITVLGRRIVLNQNGLPKQIESLFSPTNETLAQTATEVLSKPITFEVELQNGQCVSLSGAYEVVSHADGALRITSSTTNGNLSLLFEATYEFDGYTEYSVTASAKTPIDVRDIRLCIPYTKEASTYQMGLGRKGGLWQQSLDWHWDATLNQDTLWMGTVNAGLMLRLKDASYEKPYMLIYYHYKPLNLPACWHNGGLGGIRAEKTENGALLTAYSGSRTLLPNEPLTFLFDMTVTPIKPINKAEHWNDHYYHAATDDLKTVARSGANIINLHHANRYNPFINYPFWETERLREYVDRCHQNSLRVKLYYTVKELTVHTPEFWAFQSLGEEIFPSTYEIGESFQGAVPYADEWLKTFVKEKYITAWRQRINDGPYHDALEASLMHAPMSRFNNYYLEGLRWVLERTGMDGLYFDDVAFDRSIMKRIRKVLDRHHPGCTIDLHSWNYFANNTVDDSRLAGWGNSMNLYIDNFAFIDRLWFGEGFDYDETPDFWLVEMSGIPFGMMGEMLQDGGNIYRGMVYGMTCRLPNESDPRGVWKLWHDFDIANATMLGYWHTACPVQTGHKDILATLYKKPDKALIAIGSWAKEAASVQLAIDYEALALDPTKCRLSAPEIAGFQTAFPVEQGKPLKIKPGHGCILLLEEMEGDDVK